MPDEPIDARHSHAPEAVRERLESGPDHSYLKDFIYGAIDGTVTTFAVVSAVAGARLDATIVIILGVANLMADGFSMAASNYLGTRAEQQQRDRARREEAREIQLHPEGEREEVRQIFAAKGFEGDDLDRVVDIITSDERIWLDTMMVEELGMLPEGINPRKAAVVTFVAFVIVGTIPLLAYLFDGVRPGTFGDPFAMSAVMTAVAFLLVGAGKTRFTDQPMWRGALETLAVGGAAAIISYGLGVALDGFAAGAS